MEEKRTLALKSRKSAPTFGSASRQEVIDRIHKKMLDNTASTADQNSPGEESRTTADATTATKCEDERSNAGPSAAGQSSNPKSQDSNNSRRGTVRRDQARRPKVSAAWSLALWMMLALTTCAMLKRIAKYLGL